MPDGIEPTPDKTNGQSAADELAAVVTQLGEERKARAELEASIAGKDARIAELETAFQSVKKESEAKDIDIDTSNAELVSTRAARDQAVGKYLSLAKALNPGIPGDIISGSSIEEIDASIEKAKGIVEAVKAALATEAAATRVPAGAPPREGTPGVEGMSPREKIAYGTKPKGGVS